MKWFSLKIKSWASCIGHIYTRFEWLVLICCCFFFFLKNRKFTENKINILSVIEQSWTFNWNNWHKADINCVTECRIDKLCQWNVDSRSHCVLARVDMRSGATRFAIQYCCKSFSENKNDCPECFAWFICYYCKPSCENAKTKFKVSVRFHRNVFLLSVSNGKMLNCSTGMRNNNIYIWHAMPNKDCILFYELAIQLYRTSICRASFPCHLAAHLIAWQLRLWCWVYPCVAWNVELKYSDCKCQLVVLVLLRLRFNLW